MAISLPHDIIEPAAVGWWPLAPGRWLLIALLLLALGLAGREYWRRHRALAPLRQATRELQQIRTQWQQQQDARASTAALSALLKRVARHYYPHDEVAALTGAGWQDFLIRTGAGAFDANSAAALNRFYQPREATAALAPPLIAAGDWLQAQRKHAARTVRAVRTNSGAPTHV